MGKIISKMLKNITKHNIINKKDKGDINQSLRRMKLDYVDIFYHHRMDPETPLEETMGALAQIDI